MPIVERSARQCFDTFAAHVRKLVAATLCQHRHVRLEHVGGTSVATLTFCEVDGNAAALTVATGKVWFFASQELNAVKEAKHRWRLQTTKYRYRLQSGPEIIAGNALLRWEYVKATSKDGCCRHHLHAPAVVQMPGGTLDLDRAHAPTGWVTLEEVIRFLIVELGHKPPCGKTWPAVLAESERVFFDEFTGKRHKPAK